MTKRRKRWLRRLAIGVSFAAFAAPASAQPVQPADSGGGMRIVAISSGSIIDRTLPPRPAERATSAVRPDDRTDRFAIADAALPATSLHTTGRSRGSVCDLERCFAVDVSELRSVSWDGAVGTRTRHARARLCGPGSGSATSVGQDRPTLSSRGQRNERALRSPLSLWSDELAYGALGLACVQPLLEQDAKLLAGREHVRVAGPARGQLHDPNIVVPIAVTASVGSRFIERGQRRATAQEAHAWGASS